MTGPRVMETREQEVTRRLDDIEMACRMIREAGHLGDDPLLQQQLRRAHLALWGEHRSGDYANPWRVM